MKKMTNGGSRDTVKETLIKSGVRNDAPRFFAGWTKATVNPVGFPRIFGRCLRKTAGQNGFKAVRRDLWGGSLSCSKQTGGSTVCHEQNNVMSRITQGMRLRQSLLKCAVNAASQKPLSKVNRRYVYRWQRRYDGTWKSLKGVISPRARSVGCPLVSI